MTTELSDVGQDLYDQLTARTFFVVDTEFCTHNGEHHLISLAIVPVIGGRRAKAKEEFYAVMNPGVPIDEVTSSIHGFTDSDVARKRSFNHYARVILARLNEPDAVYVCHNTIDAHVLRRELERLDQRTTAGEAAITAGLAALPLMPVLDTMRIAQAASYPNSPRSAKISLDRLCDLTGVPRTKNAHDALEDARATANALIEVLRYTAENATHWTYESFHEAANGGTTHEPKGPAHLKPREAINLAPPPEHIARHIHPLSDPVQPDSDQAEAWLDMAAECTTLRCPYLRDEAGVAADANGSVLLRPLMDDLPHLTEPGQAGTLLGAVLELLAAPSTLTARHALVWWTVAKKTIKASAPCKREVTNGMCPSCQEGDPCPRDVVYIPIAERATLGVDGILNSRRVRKLMDPSPKGPINTWRKHQREILAYMLWRLYQHLSEQGVDGTAEHALEQAMALNLHTIEPRLTEIAGQRLVDDGEADQAFTLAEAVLAQRTTDTAYRDLSDWLQYTRATLYAQQPPRPAPLQYPRKGRPAHHVHPRKYS